MDQTTGLRRKMSIHEVEQRALSVASRIASEQIQPSRKSSNKGAWRTLRDAELSRQMDLHQTALDQIREAHVNEVERLTEILHSANAAKRRISISSQSLDVNASNEQSLVPIIPHDRLDRLQQSALRHCDALAFEQLEHIRREMPTELGGPEADMFSFARLKGQAHTRPIKRCGLR